MNGREGGSRAGTGRQHADVAPPPLNHARRASSFSKIPTTMPSPSPPPRRELTDSERDQAIIALLQRSVDGVPRRGSVKEVAAKFQVNPRTIPRLWKRAKEEEAKSGRLHAQSRRHDRGRPMADLSAKLERLRITPLEQRSTLRAAELSCGVPRATLQRRVKSGQLVAHVSNVKPLLTETNKAARLAWCMLHVQPESLFFKDMNDTIHVDEKLFYMTAVKRRYYLLPGEAAPHRQVRSKRYITKVMMLAAVGRPRWDEVSGTFFDGKLGIWPFVVREAAVRSSSRRPAGTMVTKEGRVIQTTYRSMLIEHLLPAVRERWPSAREGVHVRVQQDNAPAHISVDDAPFAAAAWQLGLDMELCCQPPNSPDLNCLDLGLFTAIQARQRLRAPRSFEELIDAVSAAYWELPPSTINATFLSLQGTMDACILDAGGNAFRPRHMAKAKLEREGRLPVSLPCSPETAAIVSRHYNAQASQHS
jgi:transposase-like protein